MTEKTWKCPICTTKISHPDREKHIQNHIEVSYNNEVVAFHETQRAAALLKKVSADI